MILSVKSAPLSQEVLNLFSTARESEECVAQTNQGGKYPQHSFCQIERDFRF